jgi:hypothetical protein
MTDIIQFNQDEISTPDDFTAVGTDARKSEQDVVGGAIAYPNHWAQLAISQPTAVTLAINAGSLWNNNIVYTIDPADAPIIINLQPYLPVVTGYQKWVAVLVNGATSVVAANRMMLTDVDTGQTVQQSVPKYNRLTINFVVQDGLPSPTPLQPVVPANQCCLCFVQLSNTRIMQVVSGETWRVKTLFEVEGRVTVLEGDMTNVMARTATLESDIAWIVGQLANIPRHELMMQLQRDVAAARVDLNMPTAARAYWYDPCLEMTDWDNTDADWIARLREGIRFQYAEIVDNQLQTLTPADPLLKVVNSLALPVWTEMKLISVEGKDGYKDISDQVHTVTTAVQNTISGVSVSYGPTVTVCENAIAYASLSTIPVGGIFSVDGTQYINDGLSTNTEPNGGWGTNTANPATWNASPISIGHKNYDVQQVAYDSWSQTYWTYTTQNVGVNGSVYAQSFLNSQQVIATSIDLSFTRVDHSGDVHLFLCPCNTSGAPQFNNVVMQCTVAASSLAVGWVKFSFTPTMLDAGVIYAWYTVTNGNHALATVAKNKFAGGSLFWSTDGAWAQGDPINDFAFHLNIAQFASNRTTVYFNSLTCPGGMTEMQLLYSGWAPPGTSLAWEILPTGTSVWISILQPYDPLDSNPLVGLPALAQLRGTFVGSTNLMPAIQLDTTAREAAMRMTSSMTAVSTEQAFGFSTTSITLITTVDNFDTEYNVFAGAVEVAGTVYSSPATTTVVVDPNSALRRQITNTFAVPSTTSARVHPHMTTTNIVKVPFIQDILMVAS